MEKLQDKIEKIIDNNGHAHEIIAEECRSIAIAFAIHFSIKNGIGSTYIEDINKEFDHFINQYYK